MLKWISHVLVLTLVSSCSTKWHEFFFNDQDRNVRNEKLMESFEVEEEVLEKFKVEKIKKTSLVTSQKTPTPEKKIKSNQLNSTDKTNSNKRKAIRPIPGKIQKLSKAKVSQDKNHDKTHNKTHNNKVKKKKSTYVPDYPDKLKELDLKTNKFWTKFSPKIFPGEKMFFEINYMGVSTGSIILSTNNTSVIDGKSTFSLNARAKTSSYYSYLYELDDNIDSYVEENHYRPVKFSLIQRESGQDIDDLQLYDNEKMKTYYFYKRVTKKKTKKKKGEKFLPSRFVDPLSVIWFLRGHPLNKNESYEIPIMNKGKVIILKTKMLGIEEIETELGKKEAIKILGTTKYSGETLKSGDMTFWFSNDDKRVFLRFKAKIKIGAISGDIAKYEL